MFNKLKYNWLNENYLILIYLHEKSQSTSHLLSVSCLLRPYLTSRGQGGEKYREQGREEYREQGGMECKATLENGFFVISSSLLIWTSAREIYRCCKGNMGNHEQTNHDRSPQHYTREPHQGAIPGSHTRQPQLQLTTNTGGQRVATQWVANQPPKGQPPKDNILVITRNEKVENVLKLQNHNTF